MSQSGSKGPLIVRMCNWVGEAVLSLPTLTMLTEQGYELHLVGKRWAADLFEGHGWPVHARPAERWEAVRQLKGLRQQLARQWPAFTQRPNILLLTNSFSSALEARLAGLKPIGFNKEGRGLLLAHGVPFEPGMHAADNYWRIGSHFVGVRGARPRELGLQPSARHHQQAEALMQAHALQAGQFIVLCPFSGAADTTGKKLWPGFAELGRHLLQARGQPIVLCPGPGEEAAASSTFGFATILHDVGLGTYAALSQRAAATVSNDTGPGHLAAAAGSRTISVLGPDAAPMWWVQGAESTILKSDPGWPSLKDVLQALPAVETPVR